MLKRQCLMVIYILINISILGQAQEIDTHKKVFDQAFKAGDFVTSIQSLNYIIAQEGKSTYRDTLAHLYLQTHNYWQAYYWANQLLSENPQNIDMLEVKATCLLEEGVKTDAIKTIEEIIEKSKNIMHVFQLAELQYNECLYDACLKTLKEGLDFKIDTSIINKTVIRAAMFNLIGMAHIKLGQEEAAGAAFDAALIEDADFTLAKKNKARIFENKKK